MILSRTRIMQNTTFVGPKNNTIHALKRLLTQRTQWCDYFEEITRITTIAPSDYQEGQSTPSTSTMNQSTYPFRISDIALPQDQTGCGYIFMSLKDKSYVDIGSTMCIRMALCKYNTGGYTSDCATQIHIRPFVLIAYIYGF